MSNEDNSLWVVSRGSAADEGWSEGVLCPGYVNTTNIGSSQGKHTVRRGERGHGGRVVFPAPLSQLDYAENLQPSNVMTVTVPIGQPV
jgi:hypothetical protein